MRVWKERHDKDEYGLDPIFETGEHHGDLCLDEGDIVANDGATTVHMINGHYVDQVDGDIVAVTPVEDRTAEQHVMTWDVSGEMAEFLAGLDLDGLKALREIDDDYNGAVCVWCEPCYSAGTLGMPVARFVRDATVHDEEDHGTATVNCDDAPRSWDSAATARQWIEAQQEGTYYYQHGEMGRPSYAIVQAK